jgi:DNA-binding NtrC family response regulator
MPWNAVSFRDMRQSPVAFIMTRFRGADIAYEIVRPYSVELMSKAAGRILIVDDEPILLKMMNVYLGRLGYTVVTASTTQKAWAEAQAAPQAFAVAVLDASMEGTPMVDLAASLLAADARLCVIAASGYPVDITTLQAAAPGRVMFLHKPFTPQMLGNAIGRLIATQEENL